MVIYSEEVRMARTELLSLFQPIWRARDIHVIAPCESAMWYSFIIGPILRTMKMEFWSELFISTDVYNTAYTQDLKKNQIFLYNLKLNFLG